MVKRTRETKKAYFEESLARKGDKSISTQRKIHRPRSLSEIIIYALVILPLCAGTYARNELWNSEMALWADCLKKSPNKARPNNNVGTEFMLQGKFQEAITYITKALELDPNYPEAHANLGAIFYLQGKYPEAIIHLKESLRLKPNPTAYTNLGAILIVQGKYEEAIMSFRDALQLNPLNSGAHLNMGMALSRQGKYQEAITHLNEALRISPNEVRAHFELGIAYLGMGNRDLAQKEYETLKKGNPSLANALYQKIKL